MQKRKDGIMSNVIRIPNVSRDERIGSVFNILFHIINDSENCGNDSVEWDFSDASFFHPFFLAPLAIYKHRANKRITCKGCSRLMSDYFLAIAFDRPLLVKDVANIEDKLSKYKFKTYTPICAFPASDEKVADELQSLLQDIIENQTNYDHSVKMPLAYLLSEIICNINQHSCSKYGYIYAQYLKKEGVYRYLHS